MTRIETTKEAIYHLGHNASGQPGELSAANGSAAAQAVRDLGRRIALAAALGPVEVVAVE